MKTVPGPPGYPFPVLESFSVPVLLAFTDRCVKAGVAYGWGAKVPFHRATPGKDFTQLDCSGFCDESVYLATGGAVDLPEGSWAEEQTVIAAGFKRCEPQDIGNDDGVVRIAFYEGTKADPTRHVMLLPGDGLTCESHGHHGVDRRKWGSEPFMAQCRAYVLALPRH